MRYVARDGTFTEMADWFFDPSTTDESELVTALSSIGDANQWFQFHLLLVERYRAIPLASRSQAPANLAETGPERARPELVERKWELVDEERRSRNLRSSVVRLV